MFDEARVHLSGRRAGLVHVAHLAKRGAVHHPNARIGIRRRDLIEHGDQRGDGIISRKVRRAIVEDVDFGIGQNACRILKPAAIGEREVFFLLKILCRHGADFSLNHRRVLQPRIADHDWP